MLDPKTKIFIVAVPHESQATVPRDGRRCGALEWSANRFCLALISLAYLSADFEVQLASRLHSERKCSPRRHETGPPDLTMARTPAESRMREPRKHELWERHSDRCCRTCEEHAPTHGCPRM